MSADGMRFAASSEGRDVAGVGHNAGHARVFEWDGTTWNQLGNDITGTVVNDNLGRISLSGDGMRLAVGTPSNDDNGVDAGHMRAFEWDGTTGSWNQMGSTLEGDNAGDKFGYSVAMSRDGSRMIIGEPRRGNAQGAARIWEWDGTAWNQIGGAVGNLVKNWLNGLNVAMSDDGNRVAVGTGMNKVTTWQFISGVWEQYSNMPQGVHRADKFGEKGLAMNADGTKLVVGALGQDYGGRRDSGGVRVFDLQIQGAGRRRRNVLQNDNQGKGTKAPSKANRRAHSVRASYYQPDPHCNEIHYKNAVSKRIFPSTSCEILPTLGGAYPAPNVENRTFASLVLPCTLISRLPDYGILAMMYMYKVTLNAAASDALLPYAPAGPVVSLLPHNFPVAPDLATLNLPFRRDIGSTRRWQKLPRPLTPSGRAACGGLGRRARADRTIGATSASA